MTAPLRDDLRSLIPYGNQGDQVGPSLTPARRFCPSTDRPDWLWYGHHCRRDATLQRRYGITCDDWNRLLVEQRGRCAVCGGLEGTGRRFVLDHNHDTGAVEGLCHFGCNRAITQRVRRYLADPPGRHLGLVVPQAKLRMIEVKDRAKRKRRRDQLRAIPDPDRTTSDFHARTRAALEATKQGG